MLSDAEIDSLFAQAKTPYSKREIQTFILDPDSRARETLEHVHYHNYALCNSVIDLQNYLNLTGDRPPTSLHLLLTPGYGGANDARKSLEYLADFFSSFTHGALPRWPILGWMSRSAFTLIDSIASLHNTEHLVAARRHLGEFIDLLLYKGEPLMPRDELAERLHSEQSHFLDACERNAIAISQWLDAPKEEQEKDAPPSRRYAKRKTISVRLASEITGLSESTIKRLDKDPGNSNYPGRNSTAKILAAWSGMYSQDRLMRSEVRAANRPTLGA